MYLSKNSRYIIQRTWFSPNRVRHCLNQNCRYYSTKLPREDPSRPALRVNIPNDPPVDPQYVLYQLKGCIDCEAMKPVEKTPTEAKKQTSEEHLMEINQMLGNQEEPDKGKVVRKTVSNEVLVKPGDSSQIQNSTSKESKSVSKIPVKIYSKNNLGKEKKILESEMKLINKSSKEKAVNKKYQEIAKNRILKTSLSTPEALKKPQLFLELRKNDKKVITKKKAKSAENFKKQPSETSLKGEITEDRDEAVMELRRTKAQENFKRKAQVNAIGKKETKSVGDLTNEQEAAKSPIRVSHLDNRNLSVPIRDEYLAAAIESVIPKTKTVEVKMKFRVRIDRIGKPLTNEEIEEGIDTAELAYELISDDSKPKTPKTRKTEKVVKDVLKTIVEKAKDVLEDRRLSKSVSNLKEQKVQMVKLEDLPEERTSKYGKKLTFEVQEHDDKNKVINFRRFPLPKTRLEKSVSYHGRFAGNNNNTSYLSNEKFPFPGEDYELNAVARIRSPKNSTRILKPLASQITMVDEVPEYLKYPEFKYVGLSSTASRNFHQTASQSKYRQDFPDKRPVMAMDSMAKGKEARSPRNSKEAVITRAVTSVQKETSKPIHMSIPVPVKSNEKAKKTDWRHELCKSRPIGSPLRKTRSRIAKPYKNYNIPKTNSVLGLNERLAQMKYIPTKKEDSLPKESPKEVFFKKTETDIKNRYLGSNGGFIGKDQKAEDKLNKILPGLIAEAKQREEVGNEDITDYAKCQPQKENIPKTPCQENIQLKNRAGKDFSKERTFSEKCKTFKEMYSQEFELNQKCIQKIPTQGERLVKCVPKKRVRFHKMPRWTKDNIINVMKPQITPKMADNIVNVANEPLSANKGTPSVDSLRMMEKVKKMLDLDLKNAEKIFIPDNLKKASSVLQLIGEPWKWKVNAEELEKKAAEKPSKKITSDVSVVCLDKGNEWKTMSLPENIETKKIGNENSSAICLNMASNSFSVDENFLTEMKKKSEEEFKACKGYECLGRNQENYTMGLGVARSVWEMKKPEENRQPMELKSVVALNSDSDRDHFSIVNTELAQCQENAQMSLDNIVYDINAIECCKNIKGESTVLLKNDKFEIDYNALKLAREKQSGKDMTMFPKNTEIKKEETVVLFDGKNKSLNIDSSKPKQENQILCKSKDEVGDVNKSKIDPIPVVKEKMADPPKPQRFVLNRHLPPRKILRQQRKPCYMYDYSSVEKKPDKHHLQFAKSRTKTPPTPQKAPATIQPATTHIFIQEKKTQDDVIEPKIVVPPVKPKETPVTTPPAKKEHYVSDNILQMTKNHPPVEKSPATKSNIGETVKVDVTSVEHPPSKITEINLNKDSNKIKPIPEKSKSETKILYKDLEKYQTPYSEPDYEDKPIKINSDIKSNPNMKKLDSSKTTVLNDVSKPTENIDGWLRDETDKMTNLLIKVLQEATEAKSKRKLLISSKVVDKNMKKGSVIKSKSSEDVPKVCKVGDLKKKALSQPGKSKPKSINEIPVQTSKNIQPPKTVDAVDVNNVSLVNPDFKATSEKVNKEIFNVNAPQELIDPIGINVDNITDFNIKKVDPPASSLKLNADSFKKFLKIKEIPVKPILPATAEENKKKDVATEEEEDFPGPEGLKKLSMIWKYLPAVGCQATVYLFQLAQLGASMFGAYSSSKLHNRTFNKLFSKYGSIVKLPGPLGGEVVLVNRPEHIKSIFDQEGKLPVRSVLDSVDRCRTLSQSKSTPFFSLEDWKGSDWEEVRKSLKDSTLKTEKYFDFFQNAGKLLVRRIQSNRDIHSQTSEDFMNEIRRWSLECMCYVVLDKSYGFLNFNTFDWSLEANRLMKILNDATDCILKCETGFQIWRFVDTPSSIVLSNACQSIESVVGKHVRHSEISLAKKKQDLLSGKLTAGDLSLVEYMLLVDGLSYDEILYMMLDLFLIGVNSTSAALGFLLYRLAQNTRVQRKLLKEVRNVLPDKNSELSYHRLHSLKYLQACLKESTRLNAPMPLLIRNLQHDIPLADYKVSKGTVVVMDAQVAGMKEQNFEDPEKYSPERWLDPNHMDFATVPFCHGSKAETGKRLAELQLWSCVAQMIRNFIIEYNYGDIRGTEEVISFPDKPLKLSFLDRED